MLRHLPMYARRRRRPALRETVAVETLSASVSATGKVAETWTAEGSLRADVMAMPPSEVRQAGRDASERVFRVRTRYTRQLGREYDIVQNAAPRGDETGVAATGQRRLTVTLGGETLTLDILSVAHDERRRWTEMIAGVRS